MILYRITVIFGAMVLLTVNSVATQLSTRQKVYTLEEIWSIAQSQNRYLRLADLNHKEADLNIREARDKLLPELSVGSDFKLNSKFFIYEKGLFSSPQDIPVSDYGYGAGYQFNLNIFNGGKDRRNIKIKQEIEIRKQYEFDLQKNNIKYAVAVAYYDMYKFLQFRDFIVAEIKAERKQLSTIESLYKNGIVLKSDVLRTSVKLAQLELNCSDVEKKIIVARQRLNILMGRDGEIVFDIPYQEQIYTDVIKTSGYTDYLNLAFKESPEYKIASSNIKVSELKTKQESSSVLPRLSLYSNYNYTYPQVSFYPYSNNLWGFGQTGIRLLFSIDNLYKSKHTITKARNATDQQKENAAIKKDEISLQIKETYLQLQQAVENVETAEKNITQSTETVRVIKNSYLNQESLLTDLLDAENMLLETKLSLTAALVNLKLGHLRLLAITGIL